MRREQVRSTETGFANYIADAMLAEVDADVALQNGGGIRSDQIFAADEPITRRGVIDVLPFPNRVVKVELTGATLLEALEHVVAEEDGRISTVS